MPTPPAAAGSQRAPARSRRAITLPRLILLLAAVLLMTAAGLLLNRRHAAPDVTFVSLSGEKIALQNLRGQVVIVHFWATSCAVCLKEMPAMLASYDKYRQRGLVFVAVAMAYDPPNYVLDYVQTRHLPFTVTLDINGKLAQAFGDVTQTPTTFVIGKDGTIVQRYVGQPDFSQLHAVLEQALARSLVH